MYVSVKTRRFDFCHNKVLLMMISIMLCLTMSSIHSAFASPTISFDLSSYTMGDIAVITVNDPSANISPTSIDTISILVSSNSNPSGMAVTLTETGINTGVFKNTSLIFTTGSALYNIGKTITISITDSTLNTDPNTRQTVNVSVASIFPNLSTDSLINPFTLTETGNNTGVFSSKILLTGSSTTSSSIHVTAGDILSVTNLISGKTSNALITPNPAGIDALSATVGDTITASYSGITTTASIVPGSGGGGGGGGLIRPGLVLDIIFGIVGGGNVVSPPTFGGLYYNYTDGLTLTQGNNKTTFDISHYNQEISKQVMVTGDKVNMTFKTFESYYSKGVIHMGLYLIPRGQDMITTNSIASIEWEKGRSVKITDPNHILSDANATSNSDDRFQYTQFVFTPTKSYEKMSFLVRAWNDHMYTTDVRVHDALEIPSTTKTLPVGVIMYYNFTDIQEKLQKDQFYKPKIMAHIHDTHTVFPDSNGKVYWLYDTVNHSITLVISDPNDNELFSYTSSLQPYAIEKKGDYKFMYFTVKQLNPWDIEQIQKAMKDEEEKAMSMGLEKKILPLAKW